MSPQNYWRHCQWYTVFLLMFNLDAKILAEQCIYNYSQQTVLARTVTAQLSQDNKLLQTELSKNSEVLPLDDDWFVTYHYSHWNLLVPNQHICSDLSEDLAVSNNPNAKVYAQVKVVGLPLLPLDLQATAIELPHQSSLQLETKPDQHFSWRLKTDFK